MGDDDTAAGRWRDDAELERVLPDSTAHDVTPGAHEPFGQGETGGHSAYSPVGSINQEISLYRRIGERWGTPGLVIVWVVLVTTVLAAISVLPVIWESLWRTGP
jgi:hypothetical protein